MITFHVSFSHFASIYLMILIWLLKIHYLLVFLSSVYKSCERHIILLLSLIKSTIKLPVLKTSSSGKCWERNTLWLNVRQWKSMRTQPLVWLAGGGIFRGHGRRALEQIWRPNQFLSLFFSWLVVSSFLCHVILHDVLLGLYRPKGNRAKWWCTENSKANI
jgi:hypothetical protein